MFNKFCQDSELVNSLKCKRGVNPMIVKAICPILTMATGELSYSLAVYYGDNLDEKATELLSLWLDYNKDLLTQAEEIIRLTRKGRKQSKVGLAISTFLQ